MAVFAKNVIQTVQRSSIRWALGCVNPPPRPEGARGEITQPRAHLIAELCMEKASSRSMTISLALPFQESTEMDDDTNEGEESTEMPLIEAETTAPTEKTDMQSDVDEDTQDTDLEQSDEGVFEPRSLDLGTGEEEDVDDLVVIEAKDNSGIPPSSFWLWNGAPVFNPFVDNAIDREESEGAEAAESEVAEPVQQAREVPSNCF